MVGGVGIEKERWEGRWHGTVRSDPRVCGPDTSPDAGVDRHARLLSTMERGGELDGIGVLGRDLRAGRLGAGNTIPVYSSLRCLLLLSETWNRNQIFALAIYTIHPFCSLVSRVTRAIHPSVHTSSAGQAVISAIRPAQRPPRTARRCTFLLA